MGTLTGRERSILALMILAIEPRAILEDGERVHIEDMVLINEEGCRAFADLTRLKSVRTVG
ncbi:MAG: hypothetical protein LC667_20900 [Thioalkalivibrio sp.]|nr:hypothetical protein [Thioalkalivibrio sp.]